jgi:hypothetical protein
MKNDTRSIVQPTIPSTDLSHSTNFFEFHPHLLYPGSKPPASNALRAVLPLESNQAGFLPSLSLGYSFDDTLVFLWRLTSVHNTVQSLPAFGSNVKLVKEIQDRKDKSFKLLVITTEEIHLYTVKHNADTFVVAPAFPPVSTDRTRYFAVC